MRFSASSVLGLAATAAIVGCASAHPEKHDHHHAVEELHTRSTSKCASKLAARREAAVERRRESLHKRSGILAERNVFNTIQNQTCVLAPDTIFGPYDVDGELHRHDLRENEEGIDFYMDFGVIDVETCEPLKDAWLTIWACNATGSYSGYTGINPNTVSLYDGWTSRDDGTTDDETFLRGISKTDANGMTEFLTIFPGYYDSRTTHIHVTVQTAVNGTDTSYSNASIQHVGQVFFEEAFLNDVYETTAPYTSHLSTLNRTLNSEDSVFSVANADGYSAMVDVQKLGQTYADGLVGYITLGINRSAAAIATTGEDVNVQGYLPTVALSSGAQYAAATKDASEGYEPYFYNKA